MPDPEVEAVARAVCMATGENPDQAWTRHTSAARDFIRKVDSATPANDRMARIPIVGVIEDGAVRLFHDSPAVHYVHFSASQVEHPTR
jgi:hypothetical protein